MENNKELKNFIRTSFRSFQMKVKTSNLIQDGRKKMSPFVG
jgi:hypothetical protein